MIRFERFGWQFANTARPALQDISLEIARGEFVVVTGPSGGGKTTLALAMCGLLVGRQAGRAQGRVLVDGRDVVVTPLHQIAEKIGLVQQNPEMHFVTLTVADEVAFGLENRCVDPVEIRRAVTEALRRLSIGHLSERKLATLSGGEKQRVAVASIIAGRTAAVVLDEPTASLDPETSAHLFATLAELCRTGGLTVVIIEHKLAQLLPLRPRLIVLQQGRLIMDLPQAAEVHAWPPWLAGAEPSRAAASRSGAKPPREDILAELSNVTVELDGRVVLDDVSLKIYPGEVVALLGPSGGGKTTLLHCLLGLIAPQRGTVRFLGRPVATSRVSQLARRIGVVFQNADHQLVADTVLAEALFATRTLGLISPQVRQQAERLLAQAGLADRAGDHPQRLSWGQKRRLNLISVVLHRPALLLLDEPFAGQDWENAAFLLDLIGRGPDRDGKTQADGALAGAGSVGMWRGAAGGPACVLVTHDPRIVARSCTRVLFLSEGRLIVDAPVAQAFQLLRSMGRHAYTPGNAAPPDACTTRPGAMM